MGASTVRSPTRQRGVPLLRGARDSPSVDVQQNFLESEMGKYFLGWILGVPVVVLLGIYVVMHVL